MVEDVDVDVDVGCGCGGGKVQGVSPPGRGKAKPQFSSVNPSVSRYFSAPLQLH